ncbi:MAG: lipoyl synthase [Deltaproteobacteria bacterium]|nr:lipoyl synthase [Deltaproteobacteria bacterium]MBW2500185.1 lipoyl synthase [Deltaproteobacteria bacterium]
MPSDLLQIEGIEGKESADPPRPPWIRVRLAADSKIEQTRALMRAQGLHTVCEEAACPNLSECWSDRHATVMILGSVCTRACAFCNVATGLPDPVDEEEPAHLAEAVAELGLRHVVITSVDRDDLADGGAEQFARSIEAIRARAPGATIEVLTPDFRRKPNALAQVMAAGPDVFNHNLETVPRLYRQIRPGADYRHSLGLLREAGELRPESFTKSGIMVGLGEEREEIRSVMDDLREARVDFLTVGQYLRPSPRHAPVARYWPPEEFEEIGQEARERGFLLVSASPLTRSSYHAEQDFRALQAARAARVEAPSR